MSNQLSRITLRISHVILLALATCVALGSAFAQQQRRASSNALTSQSSNESATVVFRAARDLITDGEWAKAQDKFGEYVGSYPNEKNLDAALYWMAYAQHKLARFDQCRETISRLLEKYPNSTWKDDARTLLAQAPGAVIVAAQVDEMIARSQALSPVAITRPPDGSIVYAPSVAGIATTNVTPLPAQAFGTTTIYPADSADSSENDDDPCEFKIVVLQALFQTDLQRGIIAATDWLKSGSNQTVRCKSAALTLLGRHAGKTATPVILGVARSEPDLKLRARAISTLGATNDDSVIDPLREFALNSSENEIVEASMYALSKHTNDRVIVVLSDIATSGKTPAQRKAAIASIASRAGDPAVDALLRIYDADQSVEIRKSVISGFANRKSERAGNKLYDIARSSDNVELRKAAISGVARRGGDKAVDFLLSLYDTEKNEQLKDQILSGLGGYSFNLGPNVYAAAGQNISSTSRVYDQRVVRKLIDIARNQQEPMERRKRAIGWLSRSKDPEVLKFLEELLK
jgi:tetratricopeptide (TPR) repeat protein